GGAGQPHERRVDIAAASIGDHPRHLALGQHPALMQDDEIIVRTDLVEQMRRPQHAYSLFGNELADVVEDVGARLDVEADGRLVEQQQARAVQQRPRNFQAPHLAAGEVAHLAASTVGKADAPQHLAAACAGIASGDAVQGGVIQQVLRHREVEIERAGLKHHPEQPQCFARCPRDVMAEDADMSALDSEQPRDQREERALAGAVQAEQRGEACRGDGEADVDQRLSRAIGMADAVDRQCRYLRGFGPGSDGLRVLTGGKCVSGRHGCAIVIPQGSSPTWIVFMTFCAATSITETSFETPLVTIRYFSSGVNAMCHTRWPTSRYLMTLWLVASTTAMRLAGPSATKAVLPSFVMPMPTGWMASLRKPGISNVIFFVTSRLTGSTIETVPPISDEIHISELSRLNSAKRGRASTSTLATIWRVVVSIKCAMLVVSEVLIRILPSGLMAMPSGSTPTWISPRRARFSTSMMVTVLSFSLAT